MSCDRPLPCRDHVTLLGSQSGYGFVECQGTTRSLEDSNIVGGETKKKKGEAYLSNNMGGLGIVNGPEILLHGGIIIPLLVQEIAILSKYDILL